MNPALLPMVERAAARSTTRAENTPGRAWC